MYACHILLPPPPTLRPSCAHQQHVPRVAVTARYRQNKKLMHETFVLLWLLVLGDSGVGKSKVSRTPAKPCSPSRPADETRSPIRIRRAQ